MTFHQLYRRAKKNFFHSLIWLCVLISIVVYNTNLYTHDDSTFACRKSSLRAFIWDIYIYIYIYIYTHTFHQKCHLRPSCSHTCIEIDMLCLFFLVSINDDWWLKIRGGTVHVFVPNRHVTDLSVRCMMPDNEYRRFTPNPEGVMQRCLITASRRIANATSCALVLKTKPPDSDHVLILNASLT